ncbi:MAG: hypothetical protein U9Q18_06430, partial [Caldisericota bacterium]|nr:hypothetical protein [Caldisericota bacterium]
DATVIKMLSSGKATTKKLLDSKNYSRTVFIGTEFLLSHLLLETRRFFTVSASALRRIRTKESR